VRLPAELSALLPKQGATHPTFMQSVLRRHSAYFARRPLHEVLIGRGAAFAASQQDAAACPGLLYVAKRLDCVCTRRVEYGCYG
jgi:hypothetical protein